MAPQPLIMLLFFTISTSFNMQRTPECELSEPQMFSCKINTTFNVLSRVPFDILHLSITSSDKISILQGNPFEKFMMLQVLNLADTHLESLTNTAFGGLYQVYMLTIHGRVKVIEEDAFKPCQSLQVLDLSRNQITNLGLLAIALESLINLESLNLRQNPIESISEIDLIDLDHLPIMNLDISNCNIQSIGKGALAALLQLNYLLLSKNPITHIELSNVLYNISSNLRHLGLNKLNLTQFPSEAMANLAATRLEDLSMTHHNIKLITNGSFPFMPYLLKVNLSIGSLEKIDESIFLNWPLLQRFDSSYNQLKEIPFNMPIILPNLTYVDLSHNNISLNPDPIDFTTILPNLIFLQLSHNLISYNPIQYDTLRNLETLYLDHNFIISWHRSLISDSDFALTALYIDNNHLTSVTPAMFADFSVLRHLSIHNNPFACTTCEMFELAKWINNTSTHLNNIDKIICNHPKKMSLIHMSQPIYCNAMKTL